MPERPRLTLYDGEEVLGIYLEWEPRDFWMGVYWEIKNWGGYGGVPAHRTLHVYICLLPMLPIHFEVYMGRIRHA